VYLFFVETAGRTLEDIDGYFRDHHEILVFRDKVCYRRSRLLRRLLLTHLQLATSSKRPQEYIEKENHEIRRQSSVNPRAMGLAANHRRFSTISAEDARTSEYVPSSEMKVDGSHKGM